MKKILSILIAVALLMTLTVSAFAADTETPVVTVASATAEVGEEVTLDVSITATTMAGYELKVLYDAEALELVSLKKGADAGEGFFVGSKKTGKVTYANTYNEDIEGVIFTVTFKVLAEGQHTVGLEVKSFGLDDQTTFEVATVDGVVTVGEVTPAAPAIEDGLYYISYGELTFAALAEDKTYGYAPAGDVNALTEADYITITNVDGGFTMQDCYGRYIYMTGTYNSFNVSAEMPTEGHIWTLVEVEGGYYIKNVLKEKHISFSAGYGTWGSYSDPGSNSVLNITPVELPSEENEGAIEVETTDTYGWFDLYSMTAEATGTYTFYIPAGLGVWSVESYSSFAAPELDFQMQPEGGSFTKDLTEGEVFEFYVGSATRDTWTITYTYVVNEGGEEGGEDEPVEDNYTYQNLVIGNNNVNGADIHWMYTASEAGTLTLNAGPAMFGDVTVTVKVNDGEAKAITPNSQTVLELQTGDVVKINVFATGYQTITAEWAVAGEEGGETEGNTLVLGANETVGDTEYTFTVEADGTLTINAAGGKFDFGTMMTDVDITGSYYGYGYLKLVVNGEYIDAAAEGVTEIAVTAGQVVTIKVEVNNASYVNVRPTIVLSFAEGSQGGEVECDHEYEDGVCIHCGEEDPNYQPPTEEPDGSQGNPFIIETLPFEAVQEARDDLYYQWTAPEAGTLYVYHADGLSAISGSSVASWEYCEGGKSIEVAAGDVITINYWGGTGFTVEFVPAGEVEIEYIILESVENVTIELAAGEAAYYKWIATEDGEITFEITDYTWSGSYLFVAELNGAYFNVGKIVLNVTAGDEVIFYFEARSYSGDGSLTFSGVYTVVECEHNFVDGVCTECGEEDPDYVPECEHNFVDGVCTECGEEDPDYVPECEHNFVDGVCTECGETDPNYNPTTGSMNVLAIALIAMMSLTAVVVTAKKSDEE